MAPDPRTGLHKNFDLLSAYKEYEQDYPLFLPDISSTLAMQSPLYKRIEEGLANQTQAIAEHHADAAATGRVAFVGRSPGLGLAMVIDHGRGWRTIYGGLSEAKALVGEDLQAGAVVGLLGDAGVLHFELRSEALAVNPTRWFQAPLDRTRN